MSRHDVVVVGGRAAGASTALLLARAGLRVVVLERGPRGSDTVSTHALMRAGVVQLHRWGVLADVVAAGTPPVTRVRFDYPDGDPVRVSLRATAGVAALYAPRRTVLDRVLLDAAERAGATVVHGRTVTGVRRDRAGRVVGVESEDAAGRIQRLDAALVVGADGIRSVVARDVGAPLLAAGSHAGAVLYRYTPTDATGYEWAYGDGASAGLIPTNDGQTCVFVSTTPERMKELRRSGVQNAFETLLGRAAPGLLDRVRPTDAGERVRGWGGVPGHRRQAWGPGWALVGDAGYFRDPITAHGITDALRDAELLAHRVVESLAGERSEAAAMAAYQTTRDKLSEQLWRATEQVASFDWDPSTIRTLLREVSSAMVDEVDHLVALPALPSGRAAAGRALVAP